MATTQQHDQAEYYITTIEISQEKRKKLLTQASEWAEELGSLRGSIENGDANTAGRFGELLFQEVFGGVIADHYEYDVCYNGLDIDVKTKRRTVKAQPHYEASIADHYPDQNCDLYYFISVRTGAVKDPYRYADLLGYIPPEEYHAKSTFYEEGDKDPSNGFEFSADCHNLAYDKLQRKSVMPAELKI